MKRPRFLASIASLWAVACATAIGGPIALWAPGIEPPWPEGSAAIVGVVFCVVALIIGHVCFSPTGHSAAERARLARRGLWTGCASLLASLVLCVLYLCAYSLYVVTDVKTEGDREVQIRRVIGTSLRDPRSAAQTEQSLLRDNQFDEDKVWTRSSLTMTRLFVLFAYAGMFFFLALGLGSLGRGLAREVELASKEEVPHGNE